MSSAGHHMHVIPALRHTLMAAAGSLALRDAAAARDESRRGMLNGAHADYQKNALARCEALPAAERDLCIRRTRDEGETRGSVGEGGIYREYRQYELPSSQPAR